MSVTIEVHVDADEFEFGRVIESVDGVRIELQTIIPIGEQALPLIEIHDEDHRTSVEGLREHPAVAAVVAVEEYDDRGVYAIEWHEDPDTFFTSIRDQDAQILNAVRPNSHWEFEIRFPSREALTAFRETVNEGELGLDVTRVSQDDRSTADSKEELSEPQREALDLAVDRGYYAIPREATTAELADELGISDQAVVERLRRATITLARDRL
ncbi:helix-turn-helix domain-containing protein [Halalkalicoccus salilacus]|uniref:helix-turn-helix domain-containing protein n=1 Tax=Halalkalicoccus salilacus TaxID=3117459 RepID=UPI00300F16A7